MEDSSSKLIPNDRKYLINGYPDRAELICVKIDKCL